jgi:ATP-dependent DNA helicase DinG
MTTAIQIPTIRQLLGPGGFTREVREDQIRMAELVMQGLSRNIPVIVEAGTGTGKSLATSLPAVLSRKPTVIATGTIALQEQLINKDLPDLQKALEPYGIDFTYAVAKGRGNYISKRRLAMAVNKARQLTLDQSNQGPVEELMAIAKLEAQGIADKGAFGFEPAANVWPRVQSDGDNCKGKKCSLYTSCHYFKARNGLTEVDIIVANHALVTIDMMMGGGVLLPEYGQIIIDEAHHFRDAVFDAYTVGIRTGQAMRLLRDIDDQVGGFAQSAVGHDLVSAEVDLLARAQKILGDQQAAPVSEVPRDLIEAYVAALGRVHNAMPMDESLEKIRSRVQRHSNAVYGMLDETAKVTWVETGPKGVEFKQGPLDTGAILKAELYPRATVVYTSATLASGEHNFSYAHVALGLPTGTLEGQFGSPFQYSRQCLLYLPGHLPEPNRDVAIAPETVAEMERLVEVTQGRAFLLFTSDAAMKAAYETLFPNLSAKGYELCKQGDIPRKEMVTWFTSTPRAVLLGLQSFWEGVSIEGSALSLVVMDKIPFPAAGDPVLKAREEMVKAAGLDPFLALILPQAILKLKQGIGRLIRTMSDRGIVAILDPRIQTKMYGRTIRRALPPARVTKRFPTPTEIAQYVA